MLSEKNPMHGATRVLVTSKRCNLGRRIKATSPRAGPRMAICCLLVMSSYVIECHQMRLDDTRTGLIFISTECVLLHLAKSIQTASPITACSAIRSQLVLSACGTSEVPTSLSVDVTVADAQAG